MTSKDLSVGDCIYLAGPMRGIKDFNFPLFHKATAELRSQGCTVFCPAEHDEEKNGVGFATSETGDLADLKHTSFSLRDALRDDLTWIANNATAIVCLPGWEQSRGANAEVALGRAISLKIVGYEYEMEKEQRFTDPKTGGQKGVKLERFDLIPVFPLEELARVYGKGAEKYETNNWRRGYNWSLTYGAMMRHAMKFWGKESIDPELGLHHLACVMWHCCTLMTFEKIHPDKDDRP